MRWEKQGLIYAPDGSRDWAVQYAFPPTPHRLSDEVLRIYVAFCDVSTVGRLGYVDVDPRNPGRVLGVSERPLLDIGQDGAFDENGLLPTSIVQHEGKLYLYYVGYQLGHKLRYFQFQGLAISEDGGHSFRRAQRTPVIDRSDAELVNRTSAFVMRDEGVFKMWYVGGSDWTLARGKSLPVYNMRYLTSDDGVRWGAEGRVVMDFQSPDEHAFGRPWVLRDSRGYRMFYSVRSHSRGYRLGYAESPDGVTWTRLDDQVGIDVSAKGWDSEMVQYSSVVTVEGRTYMFYNGNNCGQTGFGYAVLATD